MKERGAGVLLLQMAPPHQARLDKQLQLRMRRRSQQKCRRSHQEEPMQIDFAVQSRRCVIEHFFRTNQSKQTSHEKR